MYRYLVCALAWCIVTTCALSVEPGTPPEGYALVWSDEFDHDGPPDLASWVPETGFIRNHELQYYQLSNATCSHGILTIEAKHEQVTNAEFSPGSSDWRKQRPHSEYSSACITTNGKHTWRYGRFELRARIPTAQGTWPAFWTLGFAREWPACGEIDILEAFRGNLLANLAWGSGQRWNAKWSTTRVPFPELGPDWPKNFHTWRMDWDEEGVVLSMDGRVLNHMTSDACRNPDGTEPFKEPHYLLLNLAIGGDAAGSPGDTPFPQTMEVDWVRVYQKR